MTWSHMIIENDMKNISFVVKTNVHPTLSTKKMIKEKY
jgi:hypothetical protein